MWAGVMAVITPAVAPRTTGAPGRASAENTEGAAPNEQINVLPVHNSCGMIHLFHGAAAPRGRRLACGSLTQRPRHRPRCR